MLRRRLALHLYCYFRLHMSLVSYDIEQRRDNSGMGLVESHEGSPERMQRFAELTGAACLLI